MDSHSTRSRPQATAPRPWAGAELGIALGLTVAAFALGLVIRTTVHPGPPIGEDLDIWLFSALNLGSWDVSRMPPGYPLLAAVVAKLSGARTLWAASWVSNLAWCALPGMSWLLALRLGAGRWAAAIAAGAILLCPALLFLGQQVAPDALTAASLTLLALAAVLAVERPTWLRVGALLVCTAWVYVVREHGLIAAVQVSLLLLWLRGPWWQRGLRLGLLLGLLLLVPVLGATAPAPPWELPWWDKTMLVIRDALADDPSWVGQAGTEQLAPSLPSLAARSLALAPLVWAWVGLASLAFAWERRRARVALWVALVPGLPALVLFSEPRHVLVVLPVAAALAMAGLRRLGGALHHAWLGLALALLVAGPLRDTRHELQRARWLSGLAHDLQQLGEQLCAMGPDRYWAGEVRAFTHCPMPQYSLDGPPSAAAWKVIYASGEPKDFPWEPIPIQHELFRFYQLSSPLPDRRPCEASRPASDEPYLVIRWREPRLEPPCTMLAPAELDPGPPPPRRGPPQ
jgi:hypothetical protein